MLGKLSAALLGTILISGFAAAQSVSTFPSSINETGSNLPAVTDGKTYNPFGKLAKGRWQASDPSIVNESMPEMTGDLLHPTMGGGATRHSGGAVQIPGPTSVNESMPEMTGGMSHPTMGH